MIALRRISPGAWAMAALMAASVDTARPQEIEPRAYAATPLGVLFSGVSLGYTTGGIAFDATSPLSDVRATVYTTAIGVGGTFALAGRTANVSVGVPYAWAKITGNVQEVAARVDRSGLADARLRFAVGLLGGRAMSLGEFVRHKPSTYVGTSVTIAMPTGQYFSDKLVNVGTNRWAFKPEVGFSRPVGPWTLELFGGAWFFTPNSSFLGDRKKTQHPLLSLQSHVGYLFGPRLWVSADATFYSGGRSAVDDVPAPERQENTRVGLTTSLPVTRSNALRLAWSRGAITRAGSNFTTWTVGWQTTRIRRPARPTVGGG